MHASRLVVALSLIAISAEQNRLTFADEGHGGLAAAAQHRCVGKYCEGVGDADFLRLIDESFAFFHPNPSVPNVAMLYQPDWDTFAEGAGWGGWWIQNSYGFSYAATPFLQEPWFSTLQRSWDLFWDNQGDGKRSSKWSGPQSSLVAPDGCLGDCAVPGAIVPKQGDGDPKVHDWFYEATAAGVVMQAEILLANRDRKAMAHYLPKMERACNFIETACDPKNNSLSRRTGVQSACSQLRRSEAARWFVRQRLSGRTFDHLSCRLGSHGGIVQAYRRQAETR